MHLAMEQPLPDAVRQFVLANIPTIPHMETLLLLWREGDRDWTAEDIARRVFIAPDHAREVADGLCRIELLGCSGEPVRYRCRRDPPQLAALLGQVDKAYARHLRPITELIHANHDRKAARFARAFRWEEQS